MSRPTLADTARHEYGITVFCSGCHGSGHEVTRKQLQAILERYPGLTHAQFKQMYRCPKGHKGMVETVHLRSPGGQFAKWTR